MYNFRHTLCVGFPLNHYKESRIRTWLIKKSVPAASYGPVSILTNGKAFRIQSCISYNVHKQEE